VTEDGTIVAWGPGINPQDLANDAFIVVDNSKNPSAATGAVYEGAIIAQMTKDGPSYFYATNICSGRIEVYDTKFNRVQLHDINGHHAPVDPEIPEGFAPFNVKEINGGFLRYLCATERGQA
jgi:hypothetical protein